MRAIIFTTILSVFGLSHAGEKPVEIDSQATAFHYMIHEGEGFCLVCYTKVEKKPWQGEWEQLEISATIVEVFRGSRKVGDRIRFRRGIDGKFGNISHLHGSLNFIHFDKPEAPNAKETLVDGQDPQAVFRYSEAFHKVATDHKDQAETPKMLDANS
jgi:hypothetical protein